MRRGFGLPAIAAMALISVIAAIDTVHAQRPSTAKAKDKVAAKDKAVAEAKGWRFLRRLGVPTLIYAPGGEQQAQLTLTCTADTGLLRVVTSVGSRGVRPGDSAPIRLSNAKARFEIAGTAFASEIPDRVDIGGSTRIDERLFDLFGVGDTLRLDVPGRRRTIPVANIGPTIDAFEKACTAR